MALVCVPVYVSFDHVLASLLCVCVCVLLFYVMNVLCGAVRRGAQSVICYGLIVGAGVGGVVSVVGPVGREWRGYWDGEV